MNLDDVMRWAMKKEIQNNTDSIIKRETDLSLNNFTTIENEEISWKWRKTDNKEEFEWKHVKDQQQLTEHSDYAQRNTHSD